MFFNKILSSILIVCALFFCWSFVFAADLSDAFNSQDNFLNKAADSAGYDTESGFSLESIIGVVIQTALSFLGVVFLLLIIYGGYLWMTARGNETQVEKAKNLLTAAVVGLIIVLAAYTISYFVIQMLGEQTLKPAQ